MNHPEVCPHRPTTHRTFATITTREEEGLEDTLDTFDTDPPSNQIEWLDFLNFPPGLLGEVSPQDRRAEL
jgi:hypothetical protein